MIKISVKEVFEKAGFTPVPCLFRKSLPEEEKRREKLNQAVNDYLNKMNQAHEASKHSTLRFGQSLRIKTKTVAAHSRLHHPLQAPQMVKD